MLCAKIAHYGVNKYELFAILNCSSSKPSQVDHGVLFSFVSWKTIAARFKGETAIWCRRRYVQGVSRRGSP